VRHLRRIAGLCLVAAAAALSGVPAARAAERTAAVALFYAPTPVATYPGVVPEEYASAALSARLAEASAGRFTVEPRSRIRAQEIALRWQGPDALRFARLSELARAAGADRLVVGWIQALVLDRLGGGMGTDFNTGGDGGGALDGMAAVTLQVFDASQGRIVYESRVTGHAVGAVASRVVEAALDDAVRRGVARLIGPLAAPPGGT
jgi:curli biogenesis system outer membrane secretion channel CsgG